ncbi:ankyrin repeat and protein kinase domain-containing protein 1-like [Ostrea edulis]|uniref:ankyrin repeat and protein kinase domain-containing protein 1-like n=1 Tax=Ostrea edulis TaxID=37623 RepID=UPI0024AFF232|nr:ankyrin repeat and protein kinase domain-containing protein 1-like [Ostrea edulis]
MTNIPPYQQRDDKHVENIQRLLHVGCSNADLETSRYIIQTYPDLLHSVDNEGWNAASHAAKGGNVNILQLLADEKVFVQQKNNQGWNILHVACNSSNLEMSRFIIQTYPDLIHNVDNDGRNSALHAAHGGNVKILQLLADKGVDVKHKSSDGCNILFVACGDSNLEMSHNKVDVKCKDNLGWNILHVACENSNLELSSCIIETYPDLLQSIYDAGWNAALHTAGGGNVKILQLLPDNEVYMEHKCCDGWNILHVACAKANLEMSRYISQTYPDLLHSVDNDGWNASLHAACGGNVKILQLLADSEMDVNYKDNDGWNILLVACRTSNLDMSRYVIQAYPDLLHSVDNNGGNAALHAARGGNVRILQLLADTWPGGVPLMF